ncbi:MAG: hypothetical protein NXI32_16290 [bacterium]|nr:hypothetical protein [bacterium]
MKDDTPGLIPLMPGYFKYSTRTPIHTSFGEINLTEDYIRVAYTPYWCMPTALGVYAALTLLVAPIATIGGAGGFLICVVVYSLLTLFSTQKYEYVLSGERLVIDRTNKRIALNRKEEGRELVLGFAFATDHESELVKLDPRQADGQILKASKLNYYLIGLAIYIGGVALSLAMHQGA